MGCESVEALSPIPSGRVIGRGFRFPEKSLLEKEGPSDKNAFSDLFLQSALRSVLATFVLVFVAAKFGYLFSPTRPDYSEKSWDRVFVGKSIDLSKYSTAERSLISDYVTYVSSIIKDTRRSRDEHTHLAHAIVLESLKAKYDPLLVAAVIKSESAFNTRAISVKGARGLMQIMPATGKYISELSNLDWHGHYMLKDSTYNIQLGVRYLKYLENIYDGDRELALVAYNWGPGNLSRALRKQGKIPASTVRYAKTIISDHRKWKRELNQTIS